MSAKVLGMSLLAGVFALVAEGPAASAATLTTSPETESFALTTPQATYAVTGDGTPPPVVTLTNSSQTDSQALTFDQFDGALGNLIAVTFTFSTTYGSTATVTVGNNGEVEVTDFLSEASVDHSITNASLIDPQSSLQEFSATCTAVFTDEGCSQATNAPPAVNFNTPAGGVGLAAALAAFVGTGTYDLTVTLSSVLAPRIDPDNGTVFGDNSTYSGTLDATWNGTVSVVYTYTTGQTSVPMPLSLYLLVGGLGGIALLRRYRR